ncbi:hypothetical protein ACFLSQ_00335 [Bacteroidota bacterium]
MFSQVMMKNRVILYSGLMAVCFLIFFNIASAQKGHVVLIQGKVINNASGGTVSTTILFIDEKGKKVTGKSNSIDGTYQQVLNSGSTYCVLFKGYLSVEGDLKIDIPLDSKYEELNRDFTVKPIAAGTELFNFKMFEPNESVVTNNAYILQVKHFIDINPGAKIEVKISSYDSWFNSTKKSVEKVNRKGKKYKKRVTFSTKAQLSDLIDARIDALNKEFKANKVFLKEKAFTKNLRVVSPKKKREKRKVPGKKRKYEYFTPDFPNVTISLIK